jgi:hypothetical protein
MVQGQPGQIVCETLLKKNPSQKGAGGVTQSVVLEFKPSTTKGKRKKRMHTMIKCDPSLEYKDGLMYANQ